MNPIKVKCLNNLHENKYEEKIEVGIIKCISSKEKFIKVFLENKISLSVRKTLIEWENILPKNSFIRINRSTIINLSFVSQIKKMPNNTIEFVMHDCNKTLIMSQRFAQKLKKEFID